MFFVYRGLGWTLLVAPIVLICCFVYLADRMWPGGGENRVAGFWVVRMTFFWSGLWAAAISIRHWAGPRLHFVGRTTGRETNERPLYSCYGLRAEYWAAVYFLLALYVVA